MDNKLIFQSIENRELFKTKNLIESCEKSKFDFVFKDQNLLSILTNESINESVDAFVSGNLNLTTASAKSFVHRNTLIYRITKIKNTIGLNLKSFEDCEIYLNVRIVYEKFYKKV